MRLWMILNGLGPALLSVCVVYWVRHPEDWTGPALVAPLFLMLTLLSQAFTFKLAHRSEGTMRTILIASQIGGLALGVVLGLMLYLGKMI